MQSVLTMMRLNADAAGSIVQVCDAISGARPGARRRL